MSEYIYISIIIAITVIAILGWLKAWQLINGLDATEEYIQNVEATNQYMYSIIKQSYDNMKLIDNKQAFENDDEVGTTFQMLYEVIENLKGEFDGSEEEEK